MVVLPLDQAAPSDLYFSAIVQLLLLILINPQMQNRQSHWSRIRHIIWCTLRTQCPLTVTLMFPLDGRISLCFQIISLTHLKANTTSLLWQQKTLVYINAQLAEEQKKRSSVQTVKQLSSKLKVRFLISSFYSPGFECLLFTFWLRFLQSAQRPL